MLGMVGIGGVVVFAGSWFKFHSLVPVGEKLSQAETLSFFLTHPAKTPADHATVQKLIDDYAIVSRMFPLFVKLALAFAALMILFSLSMTIVHSSKFIRLFRQRNKNSLQD